jgi:hypothetical protein
MATMLEGVTVRSVSISRLDVDIILPLSLIFSPVSRILVVLDTVWPSLVTASLVSLLTRVFSLDLDDVWITGARPSFLMSLETVDLRPL